MPARTITAAILLALVMVAFEAYYWPVEEAYYPYNDGWDGCSKLFTSFPQRAVLYSYSDPLPNAALILIIGPTIPFNLQDNTKLHQFLESGGTILLADDFGMGNTLLEGLNVSARFSGRPLADSYVYSKQPVFPVITNFMLDPITRNLTAIVMDHPSFIQILDPNSVKELALSSPFSFIDGSGNGTLTPNESTQPYPVVALAHVGKGMLVMVANAHMFANEMINLFDNLILIRNLSGIIQGTTVYDTSHLHKAVLTDQRIAFRSLVDMGLHSFEAQVVVTFGVILAFAGVLAMRVRLDENRSKVSHLESSLHSNPR